MFLNSKIPKIAVIVCILTATLIIVSLQNKNRQGMALKEIVKIAGEEADKNPIKIDTETNKNSNYQQESSTQTPSLNEAELSEIALSVTVKIFAQESGRYIGGSGVIIGNRNQDYLVATNNHVVNNPDLDYYIKTHTGETYLAQIIRQNNQDLIVDDLALIRFTSPQKYQAIKIKNNIQIQSNETVFASGFPFDINQQQAEKISHTVGNIKMILPSPLRGGYQFGYTNTIYNGMSGGSILNSKGELIGLNGLGKSPPLGNPYIYKDGSNPEEKQLEMMTELSWGIPSKYINTMIDEILAEYSANKVK